MRCISLALKSMHFQAVVGSDVDRSSFITGEAPSV